MELGRRLGVAPAAVALSYVLHQPSHVLAAFGTRSESHLTEALTSLDIELSSTDLAWLERGDAEPEAR